MLLLLLFHTADCSNDYDYNEKQYRNFKHVFKDILMFYQRLVS